LPKPARKARATAAARVFDGAENHCGFSPDQWPAEFQITPPPVFSCAKIADPPVKIVYASPHDEQTAVD
jgi:hypothetical protein